MVFQELVLLSDRNVHDNLLCALRATGWKGKSNIEYRIDEVLALVGLKDKALKMPFELSGGEKQRVAIARALINKPDVIFADEPTGSLDSRNREEIKQLFHDLRRDLNQTIVIVTHDASLTEVADRVVTMKDGRIIDITSKEEESCAEETTEEMA
jgi:lipoprotein-releasing system ATP-binding protein